MNVCVGDIIKLENNQFVAVRDKVALWGYGSLHSFLADRNESFLISHSLVITHGLNFLEWGASFFLRERDSARLPSCVNGAGRGRVLRRLHTQQGSISQP